MIRVLHSVLYGLFFMSHFLNSCLEIETHSKLTVVVLEWSWPVSSCGVSDSGLRNDWNTAYRLGAIKINLCCFQWSVVYLVYQVESKHLQQLKAHIMVTMASPPYPTEWWFMKNVLCEWKNIKLWKYWLLWKTEQLMQQVSKMQLRFPIVSIHKMHFWGLFQCVFLTQVPLNSKWLTQVFKFQHDLQ